MSHDTPAPIAPQIRLGGLDGRKAHDIEVTPDAAARKRLAKVLGIRGIKKLRFAATITPVDRFDWHLSADLGATVVQDCVVTLDPVTTRIDVRVARSYLRDYKDIEGPEVEIPADDSAEPLPEILDLEAVLMEELALALPDFPRIEGAELDKTLYSEPGAAPLTDEAARPFAGLADLKKSLENKGETED